MAFLDYRNGGRSRGYEQENGGRRRREYVSKSTRDEEERLETDNVYCKGRLGYLYMLGCRFQDGDDVVSATIWQDSKSKKVRMV